ncbi:hypothetical protein quinque_013945 [Culex quinquefasciatus]
MVCTRHVLDGQCGWAAFNFPGVAWFEAGDGSSAIDDRVPPSQRLCPDHNHICAAICRISVQKADAPVSVRGAREYARPVDGNRTAIVSRVKTVDDSVGDIVNLPEQKDPVPERIGSVPYEQPRDAARPSTPKRCAARFHHPRVEIPRQQKITCRTSESGVEPPQPSTCRTCVDVTNIRGTLQGHPRGEPVLKPVCREPLRPFLSKWTSKWLFRIQLLSHRAVTRNDRADSDGKEARQTKQIPVRREHSKPLLSQETSSWIFHLPKSCRASLEL